MQYRGFRTWMVPVLGAVALAIGGCSGDGTSSGKGSLQSSCVSNQLNFERTFSDGSVCCGGSLCSGDCIGTPCC